MQTRQRHVLFGLLCLTALSSASCVPESESPLSDEKNSKHDEQLIGKWRLEDEKGVWHVVNRAGSKNTMEFSFVDEEKEGPYPLYATTIGKQRYMTVEHPDYYEDPKRALDKIVYAVFRYELPDQDTLKIVFSQEKVLAAAIEAKELRGKVERSLFLGRVKKIALTDSGEAIRRFLSEHGPECFADEKDYTLVFERQK